MNVLGGLFLHAIRWCALFGPFFFRENPAMLHDFGNIFTHQCFPLQEKLYHGIKLFSLLRNDVLGSVITLMNDALDFRINLGGGFVTQVMTA